MKKIILTFLFIFSLNQCNLVDVIKSSIPEPEIEIIGLKLSKVTMTDVSLLLETSIKNPYNVSIPRSDLALDVNIEGLRLTSLKTDLGKIESKSTKNMPFQLNFKYTDLIKFYNKFPSKEFLNLQLKGDLSVPIPSKYDLAGKKSFAVPVEFIKPIPSALPDIEISNFTMISPDFSQLALDSAKGIIGGVLGNKDPKNGPKIETAFDLKFLNKAASKMNLNDLKFNLELDGQKFVTASPEEIINDGKTSFVKIKTSVPILDAGSALVSIAKSKSAKYELTGISGWSFPAMNEANIPFQYNKMGSLRWK
ncbi:MAG: LEA type 2 family protein [Leptospiraceae bacterium]|nr:LEA type 2 family protein [Leptospiraceae bacterium]